MIYSIEKADLIAEQLRRFCSGYAHHLAGHFPNLDFWLAEVNEALKTIDEYNLRFNKLRDGQRRWVEDHGTIVHNYCPICKGKCEFANGRPSEPRRMAHTELSISRKNLVDNAYYFLIRCHKIGLLNLSELEIKCALIGTSIEPADLK